MAIKLHKADVYTSDKATLIFKKDTLLSWLNITSPKVYTFTGEMFTWFDEKGRQCEDRLSRELHRVWAFERLSQARNPS